MCPIRYLPDDQYYPAGVDGVAARFVELRSGLRVRVVESCSEGRREGGETVVLLAGWGCSAYTFRKNIRALGERGARVLAVELKGQGASDKPVGEGEYTTRALVSHTLDVLDALGLEHASLVGHSLGGLVAARLALAAPERVSRLALIDPVGFGSVRLVRLARLFPEAMGPLLPRVAARRWLFALALRCAYGSLGRPSAHDVDEYFAPALDPAFVRSLWSLLHEVDWRLLTPGELRQLKMPLLVIFGTEDRLVSPWGAQRMADEAPDARTILIPGAGHASVEEAPDAVNALLGAFLN
jgi:pimeloyl-ACP methyl ester carboxylesterase